MLRDLVLLVALGQQPCVWAMGYLSLGEGGRNKAARHHDNRSCFLCSAMGGGRSSLELRRGRFWPSFSKLRARLERGGRGGSILGLPNGGCC